MLTIGLGFNLGLVACNYAKSTLNTRVSACDYVKRQCYQIVPSFKIIATILLKQGNTLVQRGHDLPNMREQIKKLWK